MKNVVCDNLMAQLINLAERHGIAISPENECHIQEVFDTIRQGGIDEGLLVRTISDSLDVPFIEDLSGHTASDLFIDRIPIHFARQYGVIGLSHGDGRIPVAIGDLGAWEQLEVLSRFLGEPIDPLFSTPSQIASAINVGYQQRNGQAHDVIKSLDYREALGELQQLEGHEDLLDDAGRAPVIKLVNGILFEAVQQLASDVHIQPYEDKLTVRMRLDGVLYDTMDVPKGVQEEAISRVKVMGKMNIAEKRLAQDGRATVQIGDRLIDLRISSVPTSFGERIVIRLLDKTARLYTLSELGMDDDTLSRFKRLITAEHGLILVTGPTGSGKSTTLYAVLQEINSKQHNVITLEDPIEYQLPGISQIQVSEKKGMTFASGLRSVLRQDPDVIMVGEIRDHETAVMAIQSALTGHLVFSTLHTNDAASAVTRLLDLGIEPYLVASSVVGVMAQRLVRQVCRDCAQPCHAADQQVQYLGLTPGQLASASMRFGSGCDTCRGSGYRYRAGLFELLTADESIGVQIQSRATASQIKTTAVANGMKTLEQDGIDKMLRGVTTFEEIARITTRINT